MHVAGHRRAERFIEEALARRVVDEVGPANDVRDAFKDVVDDDGQLIRPKAVCALQNEVAHGLFHILRIGAGESVDKGDFSIGYAKAPGTCFASVRAPAAGAGINTLGESKRLRRRTNFFSRTRASVDGALGLQVLEDRSVSVESVVPEYGTVRRHAKALERAQYVFARARNIARRIDVFNANQPAAARRMCIQSACERRSEAPAVQAAGG